MVLSYGFMTLHKESRIPLGRALSQCQKGWSTRTVPVSTVQSRGTESDADAKLFLSQQLAASQKG